MCAGRSAEGPAADNRWKERMARSTASASGCGVRLLFGWPRGDKSGGLRLGGCFVCSWSRTLAL
eukprot:679752-Karenia_brevis.AAC.1